MLQKLKSILKWPLIKAGFLADEITATTRQIKKPDTDDIVVETTTRRERTGDESTSRSPVIRG